MEYVEFGGDVYEIGTDENGAPRRLSRFDKEYGVHISLHFSDSEHPDLADDLRDHLKAIYVAGLKSLTDQA